MKLSLIAGLLLTASLVWAHGESQHARKGFDPAGGEQKAFGIAGDPRKVTRTIKVAMTDNMRFTPSAIEVRQGNTIRFVLANDGKMQHEFVIGTMKELKEHAELMKKFPDMEHDEPYMAHVRPGRSEELVWTFDKPGEFDFACLIAGHFEVGMTGKIKVVAKGGDARQH